MRPVAAGMTDIGALSGTSATGPVTDWQDSGRRLEEAVVDVDPNSIMIVASPTGSIRT